MTVVAEKGQPAGNNGTTSPTAAATTGSHGTDCAANGHGAAATTTATGYFVPVAKAQGRRDQRPADSGVSMSPSMAALGLPAPHDGAQSTSPGPTTPTDDAGLRKSSISFPAVLPRPDHAAADATPDAPGRKVSSTSTLSFRRQHDAALVPGESRRRASSPPHQR